MSSPYDDLLAAAGRPVAPGTGERLARLARQIRRWNRPYDLVGDDREAALRWHFADSLSHAAPLGLELDQTLRLADLGSGAGLPGLVLACAFPALRIDLVESLGKRAQFLADAAGELGLSQVEVWGCRAEEAGRSEELRGQFDRVTARRLAALPVLLEYALPLLRIGGRAVFAKGVGSEEELAAGRSVAPLLGGGEPSRRDQPVTVPPPKGELAVRQFIMVEQVGPCPDRYPRAPGRPTRRPLTGPPVDEA